MVAAESRGNEVQKKYDECKRNFFKLREEKERLKTELEKARSGPNESSSALAGVKDMQRSSSTQLPSNGPSSELQAKYDQLKTKFHIADEKAMAADKRAQQLEQDLQVKNDQLEELYNQIDGM